MKKTKILPFLLAFALVIGLLPSSLAVEARVDEGNDDTEGLFYNKTAVYNANSDDFTVSLEAFVTGEMFLSTTPVDVVLVLDQSGSMAWCIECGEEISGNKKHNTYKYSEATSIDTSKSYYVKDNKIYTEVTYCNGQHRNFWGGQTSCTGGAGWYRANGGSADHTAAKKIVPKSTEHPDGVQFYTREVTGTADCQSRKDALTEAANTFVDIVKSKAAGKDKQIGTDDDVKHRIAVVGFGSADATITYGFPLYYTSYTNTELLSISGSNSGSVGKAYYKYEDRDYKENLTSTDYQSVLQDMTTQAGQTMVTNAINALAASGSTRTDLGLDMAREIFKNNAAEAGRKRIVVVLTDGAPTDNSGFETDVARNAITIADELKGDSYNATVYGIGLFYGADATLSGTEPNDDLDASGNDSELVQACNWFMQKLSSNNGTAQSPSYYLSAHTEEALSEIFSKIADQVSGGADSKLTATTVIKDVISPQFQLPVGADENSISVKSYAFTGMDGEKYTFSETPNEGKAATASIGEDGSISVSGFDFSENWCGIDKKNDKETNHGNKLVISFNVKAKDTFLGGNDVNTNTYAKIYKNADDAKNDAQVVEFNKPTVNVPIKDVTVTADDKDVYLLGSLTAEQIKSGATASCGNVTLDLSQADNNYGLSNWQTEYVDINVTYTDASGNTITDLSDLKDDTTYSVSVTVSPKTTTPVSTEGETAVAKSDNKDGKINVFTPELTFKDSEVYYGDTAPTDYSGNYDSSKTVWKHGTTESTTVTMIGTAPALELTYAPDATKIEDGKINTKQDIPVDVTVAINGTDVTDKTTFQHTDCTGKTCSVPEGKEFLLHVKTCSLTIKKQGNVGDDEYFVFNVKKDGKDYTQVTVKGTGSVEIKELPVGTYTVTEDSDTAWRYTSGITGSGNLTSTNPTGSFTCTNTLSNNKWLNDFTRVINTHGATSGEKN